MSEPAREQIAEFEATLAATNTMLKVSDQGFVRVAFDVDETQLPRVLGILQGKNRILRVKVEVE